MQDEAPDPRLVRQRYEIGDRLRSLRRWRNLTQEGLGNSIGVDRGTIIRIEGGRDSFLVDQALKLAMFLKVPVTWLFSDDWAWPEGGGEWGGEPPPHRTTYRHG